MTLEGIIHKSFYYDISYRELSIKFAHNSPYVILRGSFEDFFPFSYDLTDFKSVSYSVLFESFRLEYEGNNHRTGNSDVGEQFEEYLERMINDH